MSFLLALETSTPELSLALFKDGNFISEWVIAPDGRGHAEKLLPYLDAFLETQKVSPAQITSYALGVGPGSYTSLRVGMATVMALATAHPGPIWGVSTLEALASQAQGVEGILVPVLRAGRGRVYAAAYEKTAKGLRHRLKENIFEPEKLKARLKKMVGKKALFGPAAPDILSINSKAFTLFPRARSIGILAPIAGQELTLQNLNPHYLQEPDLG